MSYGEVNYVNTSSDKLANTITEKSNLSKTMDWMFSYKSASLYMQLYTDVRVRKCKLA